MNTAINQGVIQFPNTGARDAAIPAPVVGMVCAIGFHMHRFIGTPGHWHILQGWANCMSAAVTASLPMGWAKLALPNFLQEIPPGMYAASGDGGITVNYPGSYQVEGWAKPSGAVGNWGISFGVNGAIPGNVMQESFTDSGHSMAFSTQSAFYTVPAKVHLYVYMGAVGTVASGAKLTVRAID